MSIKLSNLAVIRILSLARAFEHGWAKMLANTGNGSNILALYHMGGAEAINDAYEAAEDALAKKYDVDPWVGVCFGPEHGTGSKTVRWSVAPDGTIAICSATGHMAVVAPNGDTKMSQCQPVAGYQRPFNCGHDEDVATYVWGMLRYAVAAVGGTMPAAAPMPRRLPTRRADLGAIA